MDEDEQEWNQGSSSGGQPSGHMSPESEAGPSAAAGLYSFSNVGGDGKRKRRRCLICMNAGRINHAFICPGRGNRSACATAREISKNGGVLPAESVKWNSKNTSTPTFVSVPQPVFGLPPPLPIANPLAEMPTETVYMPPMPMPPLMLNPPAPLGFLANGFPRLRRPRKCPICTKRGEDGTLCVGRQAKQRCPYYTPEADAEAEAGEVQNMISMPADSDDEDFEREAIDEAFLGTS